MRHCAFYEGDGYLTQTNIAGELQQSCLLESPAHAQLRLHRLLFLVVLCKLALLLHHKVSTY